jgi:hypothetical protein
MDADLETPMPARRRIDSVRSALPQTDRRKAADIGGLITRNEYEILVAKGEV